MKILKVRKVDKRFSDQERLEAEKLCEKLMNSAPSAPFGKSVVNIYPGGNIIVVVIETSHFVCNWKQVKKYCDYLLRCAQYAEQCVKKIQDAGYTVSTVSA